MARVKFSSFISDITGSIGQATFQRSRYGSTMRNKPIRNRSVSIKQGYSFVITQFISQSWAALSTAEQKAWDNFLSFSGYQLKSKSGIALSPFNLYQKYQSLRMYSQLDLLDEISYETSDTPVIEPVLTYVAPAGGNPSDLLLSIDWYSAQFGTDFMLKCSPIVSNSRQYQAGRFRVVNKIESVPGQWLIGDSYFNQFYTRPIAGDRIVIHIYPFLLTSPVVYSRVTADLIVQ